MSQKAVKNRIIPNFEPFSLHFLCIPLHFWLYNFNKKYREILLLSHKSNNFRLTIFFLFQLLFTPSLYIYYSFYRYIIQAGGKIIPPACNCCFMKTNRKMKPDTHQYRADAILLILLWPRSSVLSN